MDWLKTYDIDSRSDYSPSGNAVTGSQTGPAPSGRCITGEDRRAVAMFSEAMSEICSCSSSQDCTFALQDAGSCSLFSTVDFMLTEMVLLKPGLPSHRTSH